MEIERDEQVIFVKDLLFAALYQWRRILAAALMLAVVFGGVTGILEWKKASDISPEMMQEQQEYYAEQKQLLEEAVVNAEAMVQSQKEYNEQSAIMALDPYGVYRATIELTVQTDYQILPGMTYQNPDNTGAVLRAYVVHLSGDQVMEDIAQAVEIKSKYLPELIWMENDGDNTRSLSITVSFPTAEGAQKILDMLMEHLERIKPQIEQSIGAHTVNVVTGSVDERIDLSITDKQSAAINRLENLKNDLWSVQEQLEVLEAPSFGVSAKKIVILAVLGGILGAGLMACSAWFTHIAGGKVYSARTLKNKTGLKMLGCVPAKETVNPVDLWLRKLEGRSLGEEQAAIAAATVRNYCADTDSLLIVGDCALADQELVAQVLKDSGVQVSAGGSLLRLPRAQEALSQSDAVLLVERCGCSRYSNVQLSMERIADQDKKLIGCVLLDG